MIVKFCGLRTEQDILAANRLHPDMIVFVFVPDSRRHVSPEQAARLKALLAPDIQAVGVFAGQDPAMIEDLARQGIIDVIQLHGAEPDSMVRRLQQSARVIRAFQVAGVRDLETAAASAADMILLDAGSGQGQAFDWTLLEGFTRPYILAGGLDPDRVPAALALNPAGLDVSTGIETEGSKDPVKMAAFLAACGKENHG